ncbi:hypothetical protein [Azospirillum brasilense]|uniref:hypothetical protein n=1 Tax=Azospirillum brasilense TaxID=192 RepID=UPI0020002237|nr:hypothetical protein [Azospirillum brasilense]
MDSAIGGRSHLIADIATEAGNLGIEIADIAGHVEEVNGRLGHQANVFAQLRGTGNKMSESTQRISAAATVARSVTEQARQEVESSHDRVQRSMDDIHALVAAVGGHRGADRRPSGGAGPRWPGRQGNLRHCQADQPAGAQRDH